MKFKLFNLVTVFLATSGLVAPAQAAAVGHTLKRQMDAEEVQHLVCVKEAQHFLCDFEKNGERDRQGTPSQAVVKSAKATQSHKSSSVTVFPQLLSPAQQKSIANALLGFIYFVLPCGLVLGLFLYDKYYAYRAAVLQKQIELLEQVWQSDSDNDGKTNEQIELLERLWKSDSDNDATTDTGRGAKD